IRNIASAHLFARAKVLCGTTHFTAWRARNAWMQEHLRYDVPRESGERAPHKKQWGAGNTFERLARTWQQQRLAHKQQTACDPEHFICTNNTILLAHPESKNKKVMERFDAIMQTVTALTI
ncbi:MAG: hypothetical protein AAB581_03025, partial [Patescibacteria group bacterium]